MKQVIHCRHRFWSHCTCKHKQRPQIDYTVAPGVENILTAVIVTGKTEKLECHFKSRIEKIKQRKTPNNASDFFDNTYQLHIQMSIYEYIYILE